jgi:hypothetical protein
MGSTPWRTDRTSQPRPITVLYDLLQVEPEDATRTLDLAEAYVRGSLSGAHEGTLDESKQAAPWHGIAIRFSR